MLLLELDRPTGPHAWDVDHGNLDQTDPADKANCALGSLAMINHFAGGDMSQDRMGYEILRFRLNDTRVDFPSGDFSFGSMTTGLQPNGQNVPNTGNDFAALLLGYVRSGAFDLELAMWQPRSSIQSWREQLSPGPCTNSFQLMSLRCPRGQA